MSKLKILKLTDAELGTIEYWLERNAEEGWYYGNQKHYYNRLAMLKMKIQKAKGVI